MITDHTKLITAPKAGGWQNHSPGLWTNTCCCHPAPGEVLQIAAEKRLKEEMGFSCSLSWLFKFS